MSAQTEYLLVRRLPNGNNVRLNSWDVGVDLNAEQLARAAAIAQGEFERINNPAWRVILYSPTDGVDYTEDDIIWDSSINVQ